MPQRSAIHLFRNRCACATVSTFLAVGGLHVRADQSITLRSGNGPAQSTSNPTPQDSQIRFLHYAVSQDTPPGPADFNAVQTAPFAYINKPYTTYVYPLPTDPLAQWVGTSPALADGSVFTQFRLRSQSANRKRCRSAVPIFSRESGQHCAGIENVRLAQFLNSPSAASNSSSVSSPGQVPKKATTPLLPPWTRRSTFSAFINACGTTENAALPSVVSSIS